MACDRQVRADLAVHREAEVHHVGVPVSIKEDVAGLQVSVNDPALVDVGHRARDLAHDPHRPRRVEAALLLQDLREALAVDQVHHVIDVTRVLADFVDANDVPMSQPSEALGLPLEALEGLAEDEVPRHEDFDGHVPIEPRLADAPNHPHAPPPELIDHVESGGQVRSGHLALERRGWRSFPTKLCEPAEDAGRILHVTLFDVETLGPVLHADRLASLQRGLELFAQLEQPFLLASVGAIHSCPPWGDSSTLRRSVSSCWCQRRAGQDPPPRLSLFLVVASPGRVRDP